MKKLTKWDEAVARTYIRAAPEDPSDQEPVHAMCIVLMAEIDRLRRSVAFWKKKAMRLDDGRGRHEAGPTEPEKEAAPSNVVSIFRKK